MHSTIFFTDSGSLLPNSSILVRTLLTGQLPSKKLRIEHELPRYGKTDIDSLRYFGELLTPHEGDPHSGKESGNSTPIRDADDDQSQSLSSDLLRGSAALDTPLEHSEARVQSGTKVTTIDVKSLPLDMEGQPTMPAHMEGIASADKLVSPHYFEDAMLVTPFCVPDANFDYDVE